MGIISVTTFTSATETVTKDKLNGLAKNLVTEFNGNIENANVAADAAIAETKLDLSTITQNVTFSGTVSGASSMQSAFDGGQTITIADNDDQTLSIINNDVTNNPTTLAITSTSPGIAAQVEVNSDLEDAPAVGIHSNTQQTNGWELLYVYNENAASDNQAVHFTSKAGYPTLYVGHGGTLVSTKGVFEVHSGEQTTGKGLAYITSSSSATTIPLLTLNHPGGGQGAHIRFEGDPPNSGTQVDGDLWYTGSALNFYDGSSTTDLLGTTTEIFTSDGTFTTNASTTAIWVYMVGGGGGGGTFGNNEGGGGGGGGASLYSLSPIAVSASTGYNVQVGDAGAGGSGGTPAAGANGQDSTFGAGAMATALTAAGGVGSNGDDGGAGGAAPTATAAGNGGQSAGGLVGYGILGYAGGNGSAGVPEDGGNGGGGGGTMFGPGADGATSQVTPTAPGANTGAGGGGAQEIHPTGGAGAKGIVIIRY